MRHCRKIVFLCGILINTAFSCEQDASLTAAEDADIDFQFRLLNENGVPATTFQYGENFVFSFLIINNTELQLRLLQSSLDQSEFFKVYTLKSSSTETKNETERGKPYSVMFCDKVSGIPIPPNDTLKLEIPWMPESPWQQGAPYYSSNFCLVENNSPLNVGKYKTEFSSAFEFFYGEESFVTETMQFHIEFEIKP